MRWMNIKHRALPTSLKAYRVNSSTNVAQWLLPLPALVRQRLPDLTAEEAITYGVASILRKGGQLSDIAYKAPSQPWGDAGTAELCCLIGSYTMGSVLFNG